MKKANKVVKVKECVVGGKKAFGLTDGKKWFFYAYVSFEQAESMLQHFNTSQVIEVNISQPSPFKIVDKS